MFSYFFKIFLFFFKHGGYREKVPFIPTIVVHSVTSRGQQQCTNCVKMLISSFVVSPYNRPSNKFQKSALPSPPLYIPRPPNSLTQYLHGAIEQREHLASQGSKTVHLIQQEAHLFSADPNNPESTEALGQHWLTSLYGCPIVAR